MLRRSKFLIWSTTICTVLAVALALVGVLTRFFGA